MITLENKSYYPQTYLNVDNSGIEHKILYMALTDRINPLHPNNDYNLRQGGTFDTVNDLVYLWKKMGITDIWLNPVLQNRDPAFYNTRGELIESYFGYWTVKPFEIEAKCGGETSFKNLITTLSNHHMGIVLDIPFKSFGPCLVNESYADKEDQYKGNITLYNKDGSIFAQWPQDVHHGQHLFTGQGSINGDHEWNNVGCLMYKDITTGCPTLNLDDDRVVSYILHYTKHLLNIVIENSNHHLGITLRLDAANHLLYKDLYGQLVFGKLWHELIHTVKGFSSYDRKLFVFQEHYGATLEDETYPLWRELPNLVNTTGVSIYDFGFHENLKTSFTHQKTDKSYGDITNLRDYIVKREHQGFHYPLKEKQILFLNSHDEPRFMDKIIETRGWNEEQAQKALEAAYTILLTSRGVPMIFYGDDIYLHAQNDQYGYIGHHRIMGGDPFNRPNYYRDNTQSNPESYNHISWIIRQLSGLRQMKHQGILYGETQEKWITNNIFAYERSHHNDTILVIINSAPHGADLYEIPNTGLPSGKHINLLSHYGDTRQYVVDETGTLKIFDPIGHHLPYIDRFDHIVLATFNKQPATQDEISNFYLAAFT